jgi:centrosomal protein CEP290
LHVKKRYIVFEKIQILRIDKEKATMTGNFNEQIEKYKQKIREQEHEIKMVAADLDMQKELNTRSPTNTMKNLVEKLKQQLLEKEQQHKNLSKALVDLRGDMVSISKSNLLGTVEDQNYAKQIMDKNVVFHLVVNVCDLLILLKLVFLQG